MTNSNETPRSCQRECERYPLRAVALTSAGMPAEVALCRDARFDALLLKPVRLDDLFA
jgi:hypothetical protein